MKLKKGQKMKKKIENMSSKRPQRERKPPQDPLGNISSMEGKSYMQTDAFNFSNLKEDLNNATTRHLIERQ